MNSCIVLRKIAGESLIIQNDTPPGQWQRSLLVGQRHFAIAPDF